MVEVPHPVPDDPFAAVTVRMKNKPESKNQQPVSEPVTVKTGSTSVSGFRVPTPEEILQTDQPEFVDSTKVKVLAEETLQVAQLLSHVFSETDSGDNPASPTGIVPVSTTETGLDAAHQSLVAALITRDIWNPDAFRLLVRQCGIALPEGALETVNEWACLEFDAPLLKADGDWIVEPDVVQAMRIRQRQDSI